MSDAASPMLGDEPKDNLLVWCFNETNKNGFATYPRGVGETFDTRLLSIREDAVKADVFRPKFIEGQGYSARRLNIVNKKHLDLAIESCEQELATALTRYKRVFVMVVPFWYRMAIYNAVNKRMAWDRVTGVESPYAKVMLAMIRTGDALLELPTGLLMGDAISKRANGRGPEEASKYRKMPPSLQYMRKAPKVQLTPDDEAPYCSGGGKNVDWRSFRDDDDNNDDEE